MSENSKTEAAVSRRNFLLSSGAAVAATLSAGSAVAPAEEAAAAPRPAPRPAPLDDSGPNSPVHLVNLLQGTESSSKFSRGNTLPIAARPFGMAHWTLQSHEDTPWMFEPHERRLQGFRSTHQLSPWLGDYGHATFLPFSGDIKPDPAPRASSYRFEDATLLPHTLQLRLLRYGIDVELIPTERCALFTAAYSKPEGSGLLIDIPGDHPAQIEQDPARRTLRFASSANSGGVPQGFATYYVLRFDQPWKAVDVLPRRANTLGLVRFPPGTKSMAAGIGTSFISYAQAEHNLDLEIGTRSAGALRQEGEAVWNQHLGKIKVAGGTPRQEKTFYSCLYRTMLFPRIWHEPDEAGKMHHRSPYTGQIVPGVMYADHGYWDVYRAWYPLMTVLLPERLAEILQAWVNVYQEGGWLPQFPCPGYRACMTGSLIDSVFGDAAAKGLKGFDLATAYAGLKKHATQPGNPDAGYGRRGIEEYLKHDYAPADRVGQSAAETVDAAYGDFCIAQVAHALGNTADRDMFLKRSGNWRHLFDPKTGFLRGKNVDGSFVEPFDPVTWDGPYVEGAAWQHRWDVPHDMPGLIAALGGPQKASAALQLMLSMPADFNVGGYGEEIHEMSEMAAVPFGQYAHSNQPVHHVLYLFAAAGRPDLTRAWTRRVMDELYTPDTFAGDEDTGSMAAWYILSALGFYPHCPGKPEYTLGRALFPEATLHLAGGKQLRIEDSTTARSGTISLNGSRLSTHILTHAQVMAGGTLRFEFAGEKAPDAARTKA